MTVDPERIPLDRPARPGVIEAAAAVLIIGGVFRLLAVGLALVSPAVATPIPPEIAIAETVLQVLTIGMGILIRQGRSWLPAVNIIAVLAFIELLNITRGSVVSLAFGILFALAFAATFLNKPWFDAMSAWRARPIERRA